MAKELRMYKNVPIRHGDINKYIEFWEDWFRHDLLKVKFKYIKTIINKFKYVREMISIIKQQKYECFNNGLLSNNKNESYEFMNNGYKQHFVYNNNNRIKTATIIIDKFNKSPYIEFINRLIYLSNNEGIRDFQKKSKELISNKIIEDIEKNISAYY
jgi:hypothetical protein